MRVTRLDARRLTSLAGFDPASNSARETLVQTVYLFIHFFWFVCACARARALFFFYFHFFPAGPRRCLSEQIPATKSVHLKTKQRFPDHAISLSLHENQDLQLSGSNDFKKIE